MGLAQAVSGYDLIGLDSSVFIYLYERHPVYYTVIEPVFSLLDAGNLRAVTSLVTLVEVSVLPLRQGRQDLVDIYTAAILNASTVTAMPLDVGIARKASELRAKFNLRTPDAIQIATSIRANARAFITNDARLRGVDEIPILVIGDFIQD